MDFISGKLAVTARQDAAGEEAVIMDEQVYFTASEQQDEAALYADLHSRLGKLEASVVVDSEGLDKIREAAAGFRLSLEEWNEIKLRIDWLERLYNVSEELEGDVSPLEASQLLSSLAPVQACPLKAELMAKLQTMTSDSIEDAMQRALAEAGDDFVNLGSVGREFVLAKAGEDVERIRELSRELESVVSELSNVETAALLVGKMETLPLQSLQQLSSDHKITVAGKLLEQHDWNGLAALDRSIGKLVHQLDEEQSVSKETLEAVEIKKYIQE